MICNKLRSFSMGRWSYVVFVCSALLMALMPSCKKDKLSTDPSFKLSFSTDTLAFDTVFSTIGSSTRIFKVYNPNKQKISISSISLSDQAKKYFRCNVNGLSGTTFSDVELRAEDSLWVFVEVTVDPNENPQFLELFEPLNFVTNGNEQHVLLQAYPLDIEIHSAVQIGEDFYITSDETWTDEKAHLVYGLCHIDSNSTLKIEAGARVHFSPTGGLVVEEGSTLNVEGEVDDIARFEGMRLESWYENVQGQWKGVYLMEGSVDHRINALHMRNSTDGLYCAAAKSQNDFAISIFNSEFNRNLKNGLSFDGTSAELLNVEVLNNGANGIEISSGDRYEFYHITVANFGSAAESAFSNSALEVSSAPSALLENGVDGIGELNVVNSIIDGDLTNELVFSGDEGLVNYKFDHCAIKLRNQDNDGNQYINCIFNGEGKYIDPSENNFLLGEGSEFIEKGSQNANSFSAALDNDKNGTLRPSSSNPDLGALVAPEE